MKSLFFYILLFPAIIVSCRTSKNSTAASNGKAVSENNSIKPDYSEPTTWVLGYFNKDRLLQPPHSEWYYKGYDEYKFDNKAVNSLMKISKEGISIKIVMGTWCPDSRREVPRFMKILDQWQFTLTSVTFIGVDNVKLAPVGEYEKLDIQRVPTFIIYKNNIEAGRIIENPVTSLEQDLVNILKQE